MVTETVSLIVATLVPYFPLIVNAAAFDRCTARSVFWLRKLKQTKTINHYINTDVEIKKISARFKLNKQLKCDKHRYLVVERTKIKYLNSAPSTVENIGHEQE